SEPAGRRVPPDRGSGGAPAPVSGRGAQGPRPSGQGVRRGHVHFQNAGRPLCIQHRGDGHSGKHHGGHQKYPASGGLRRWKPRDPKSRGAAAAHRGSQRRPDEAVPVTHPAQSRGGASYGRLLLCSKDRQQIFPIQKTLLRLLDRDLPLIQSAHQLLYLCLFPSRQQDHQMSLRF
ncbi:Flagellar motor switch protein FliG C-terminal domain-containing protein, partial [Dysosmobacter welbionis]